MKKKTKQLCQFFVIIVESESVLAEEEWYVMWCGVRFWLGE